MFQAAVEYIKTYKQGSTKPRTRIKTNSSRLRRSSISSAIEDRFAIKEDASRRDAVRHNCYVWGITGALSSSAAGGSLPETMHSLAIVSMISCGSKHCLAIDRQGCCFTWGWGGDGQLGHGSCDDIAVPTRVALIQDAVVQVAGGSGHSVALTSSGTVFTWGMHFNGQLGRDIGSDGQAALVPGLVSDLVCICDISAGGDSTFAYSEQTGLYAWGCNREGQLGIDCKDTTSTSVPLQVAALANVHLLGISVAASHALFIDLQSRVWGCGSNSNGQLGYGSDCKSVLSPTLLPSLRGIDVLSVACGFSCSLFLTAAGQVIPSHVIQIVFLTVRLQVLQAGQISIKAEAVPTDGNAAASVLQLSDDFKSPIQFIEPDSPAARMLLLLGADPASPPIHNKIFSMHNSSPLVDSRGRLIGAPPHLSILPLDPRDPVVCISAGSFHAGCVTRGGIIYTFGDGDRGQLGHGKLSSASVPTAVPSLAGLHIQSISCGFWHSMCLVRPGDEKVSPQEAVIKSSAKSDISHDDWIVLRENLLFSSKMWCSVRNGFMLLYARKDAPTPKTVLRCCLLVYSYLLGTLFVTVLNVWQVISLEVAGVTDVSLVGSFGFTLTVINKKWASIFHCSTNAAHIQISFVIRYQFLCESELQLESWINTVTFAKVCCSICNFVANFSIAQSSLTFCQIAARTNAGTLNEVVGDSTALSSDDLRKRLTTGTTMCKLVLHNKNRRHLRLVSVPKDANCIMWQDLNSDADTHHVQLRDVRYRPFES
jgi:alpha-tubulin suppressor-like RCC1 family protein